jgi:hypothetical protein
LDDDATNVGEAAHISGSKFGSARYVPDMTDPQRSDVTNGIWLCCTCHKKVDDDPTGYPAELLIEWKRDHEAHIRSTIGRSFILRKKAQDRILAEFPKADYLAEQIILDKPDLWEYKLLAQLLRTFLHPVQERIAQLNDGFYALPVTTLSTLESFAWLRKVQADVINQTTALTGLVNAGISRAVGPPGSPGSTQDIYSICILIRDACERCLGIEELVRFSAVSEEFQPIQEELTGIPTLLVREISKIEPWTTAVLESGESAQPVALKLSFELPEGWGDRMECLIEAVGQSLEDS